MADPRSYELQSLSSHEQMFTLARSKTSDYEGIPVTPSKDELLAPSRRLSQSPPPIPQPPSTSVYRFYDGFNVVKGLLLPLVAIAYLAFCYTVHNRKVPLKTTLFDTSPDNLGTLPTSEEGVCS